MGKPFTPFENPVAGFLFERRVGMSYYAHVYHKKSDLCQTCERLTWRIPSTDL